MAYLRFSPTDYQAIAQRCRDVHLREDAFPIFKYFLADVLREHSTALAERVAQFGEDELRLLFRNLRAQKGMAVPAPGQEREGGAGTGLTSMEYRAIAQAGQWFVLRGGQPGSFQAFLVHYFRGLDPALADKLGGLTGRQVKRLYRRVRTPNRWRHDMPHD
jgi:hypothetical protein